MKKQVAEETSEEILIDTNDFKTFKVFVTIENTTARTVLSNVPEEDLENSKRDSAKKPVAAMSRAVKKDVMPLENIRIVEFLENGLVLEMPQKACAKGHSLVIHVRVDRIKGVLKFDTTSKVVEIEKQPSGEELVTTQFVQFKEEEWKMFQELYSGRQNEIFEFFQAVKG